MKPQTSKKKWPANVEPAIAVESSVTGMAEWNEGAGRSQRSTCEHRPDESEKGKVTLSKTQLTGGGRSPAFEPLTIVRFGFCGEQNFHSIVIVVPLHVSKFSRVLK
jgi:hypothetical protein